MLYTLLSYPFPKPEDYSRTDFSRPIRRRETLFQVFSTTFTAQTV